MRGLEGYGEVMEMSKQLCHSFRPAPRPVKRLPPVLMRLSCSISPSLDAHYSALLAKSSSFSQSVFHILENWMQQNLCKLGKAQPMSYHIRHNFSLYPIHIAFLIDSIVLLKGRRSCVDILITSH